MEPERSGSQARTPLFRFAATLPQMASEVRRALVECGEYALVDQVETLWVCDRCRCGNEDCATLYTSPEERPTASERAIGARLPAAGGYILIEVADEHIVSIEAFDLGLAATLARLLP